MLYVRDLQRSLAFYTTFLNLRVTETVKSKFAFLTSGWPHHELALYARGAEAAAPLPNSVGLCHLAFNVPDKGSFAEAYQRLRDANIEVSPVDHQVGWGVYFHDPDGNSLEIYCDTRNEPDGTPLWRGENRLLTESRILASLDGDVSTRGDA
jgi:catechol-2,3-dioxygenase